MRGEAGAIEALDRWVEAGDSLATTEVNYFEVAAGIEMPRDKRLVQRLAVAWAGLLGGLEVLPVTRRATNEAVRRQFQLYRIGRPAAYPDLMVAAVAKVGGCDRLVTRDERDFKQIGLLPVEGH